MKDYQLDSYNYNLPSDLIAHYPVEGRHHSRMLVYSKSTKKIEHHKFLDLPDILSPDYLMVFNESRVFPCRLLGQKSTGGRCEVFLLSCVTKGDTYPALLKTRGRKRIGDEYHFPENMKAKLVSIEENGSFVLKFNFKNLSSYLEKYGSVPIPPYIRDGVSNSQDSESYQTVFARNKGSVAAPTAGLHFTLETFTKLKKRGVEKAFVTLHVGMGTFAPVNTENIKEHSMHEESFFIDRESLQKIEQAKKILAVGTTSLRTLESIRGKDILPDQVYQTDIFLYPGKAIHSAQALLTNFHLPKSTLLMLVAAFIGREEMQRVYQEAIQQRYRFYSYGDSMLILP
jgi:S-adenosylmethionine:tRNA ribosyltransferase-isomerase